jgi:hypothetical protein
VRPERSPGQKQPGSEAKLRGALGSLGETERLSFVEAERLPARELPNFMSGRSMKELVLDTARSQP